MTAGVAWLLLEVDEPAPEPDCGSAFGLPGGWAGLMSFLASATSAQSMQTNPFTTWIVIEGPSAALFLFGEAA